jgi:hypothetical protein
MTKRITTDVTRRALIVGATTATWRPVPSHCRASGVASKWGKGGGGDPKRLVS